MRRRDNVPLHGEEELPLVLVPNPPLGLEVREAPEIVADVKEIVRARMVFTIEPGVYVPGKMGVRIEDNVVAREHGCKVLTKALPKEFEWWK